MTWYYLCTLFRIGCHHQGSDEPQHAGQNSMQ